MWVTRSSDRGNRAETRRETREVSGFYRDKNWDLAKFAKILITRVALGGNSKQEVFELGRDSGEVSG